MKERRVAGREEKEWWWWLLGVGGGIDGVERGVALW